VLKVLAFAGEGSVDCVFEVGSRLEATDGEFQQKKYGFLFITRCCSVQHKREFSKREKTDCQSVFSSMQPLSPESVAEAKLRGDVNRKVYGFISLTPLSQRRHNKRRD
jgi:hypothetical protein